MSDNDGTFSVLQEDDKKYFEEVISKYCNTSAVLEKLIETESAVDGVYDLLNSEVDAQVDAIIEERLSSLEFKMDTLLKELASIKNSISGNIVDRVNNNTDTSMKYILDSVLSVERGLSKLITEQNELKLNFYIRINELEKKLEQHKSVSEEIDSALGSKIDKLHNSIIDRIDDGFENVNSDMGDISDLLIGQAGAIVDNTAANLNKELNKRKYVTKDYLDLVRNDLADKIDSLHKNVIAGLDGIANSILLMRDGFKFDNLYHTIDVSTNKILYSFDEKFKGPVNMLIADKPCFEDFTTPIVEIKNDMSKISADVRNSILTVQESVDKALDDIKDSVNDLSEDMVELTLSINNNFPNKELKEKVNKLETGFDNVIKMLGSG